MTWVDFVVRGTILLAAAFAAASAARRASAAVRHFIWTAVFVVMLLLPVAMKVGPRFAVGIAPVAATGPATVAAMAGTTAVEVRKASGRAVVGGPVVGGAVVGGAAGTASSASAAGTWRAARWAKYWAGLYLAGLLVAMGRFLSGAWRMGQMARRARPAWHAETVAAQVRAELGIGRAVRVLESADAPVPMTWGVIRPVVLLPDAAHTWPQGRLHAVLLHEMVHVARYDVLAQMAAQAACCVYWFHPLVWLAARQLRKERERACDDAVLERGVAAPDYAGHLMELARVLVERRASLAGALAMAEAGDLEERVRALLDPGRNRAPLTRRVATVVAALACALVLPVASVTSQAQEARGALAGIVQDISSARVPGCEVGIKNLDGRNQETATANAAGEYSFLAIPPGRYALEVRSRGFAIGKSEVVVQPGIAARGDVTLQLGQISEAVTVRGSRPAGMAAPMAASVPVRAPQRIRVGGNVQAAKLLRQTRPVYPPELVQLGVAGTVLLRAVVSTTGETLNPEVVNTTVHPGLAKAALDAVRQWRYEPTLLNGQPVEVATTIAVTFELEQ